MNDDIEIRRRRAAYRASHRGTKEMDIILGRFAEARLPGMSESQLSTFERFLALSDPLITAWFNGAEDATEAGEFETWVADLRAHHGLPSPASGKQLET